MVRGLFLVLLFVGILVLALWFITSQGKTHLEQDISAQQKALMELTRINLNSLEKVIIAYSSEEGRLPASLEEMRRSRFLTTPVVDAWGREIRYELLGEANFRLLSAGADGAFGTEDDIIKVH